MARIVSRRLTPGWLFPANNRSSLLGVQGDTFSSGRVVLSVGLEIIDNLNSSGHDLGADLNNFAAFLWSALQSLADFSQKLSSISVDQQKLISRRFLGFKRSGIVLCELRQLPTSSVCRHLGRSLLSGCK